MWIRVFTIATTLMWISGAEAAEYVCRPELGVRCSNFSGGCIEKKSVDLPTLIRVDTAKKTASECYNDVGCSDLGDLASFQEFPRAIIAFALGRATTQELWLDREKMTFRKSVGILGDEAEIVWGKCQLLTE